MSSTHLEIQHILVPYDFSETAKVALDHAATIAGKVKGKITLLHVKEPFAAGQFVNRDPDYKPQNYDETALKKMEEDTLKLRVLGIKTDFIIQEGKIYKQTEAVVKDKDINLIVIGTHGVKGRDSFFLGSNAYKVVNHLKIPVLTVQSMAKNPEYRKIFMPLDETLHTREKVPYAKLFAEKYNAELVITGLQKHRDQDSVKHLSAIVGQAVNYVSDSVTKVSSDVCESKNNAADTLKCAEDKKADLIVIMSEQEKSLSGLFLGPYALQIVNASTIPVLIVPPKVVTVMSHVSI